MDLTKLSKKKPSGDEGQYAGFLKKNFTKAKNWLLPPTSDRRKQRFQQYKDLGLFIVAVGVVAIFQDKIKKFIQIQTDDIRKMAAQGPF